MWLQYLNFGMTGVGIFVVVHRVHDRAINKTIVDSFGSNLVVFGFIMFIMRIIIFELWYDRVDIFAVVYCVL